MAISALHYCIIRDLHLRGLVPQGGAILELGEANWYGDADPKGLVDEIRKHVPDPRRRDDLLRRLDEAIAKDVETCRCEVAKIFYDMYYAPSEVQAIDFHGSPSAHKLDLNAPVTLDRRFDVVMNHGTAEHIFDVAQVFITMHDYTVPGGMMIHEGPFTGWIDHGFYSFQPTLFYDLAAANQYEVLGVFVEDLAAAKILRLHSRESVYEIERANKLPDNTMLLVVLIKGHEERPFQFPVQGRAQQSQSDSDT